MIINVLKKFRFVTGHTEITFSADNGGIGPGGSDTTVSVRDANGRRNIRGHFPLLLELKISGEVREETERCAHQVAEAVWKKEGGELASFGETAGSIAAFVLDELLEFTEMVPAKTQVEQFKPIVEISLLLFLRDNGIDPTNLRARPGGQQGDRRRIELSNGRTLLAEDYCGGSNYAWA
jgi:hypothetical protein